MLKKKIWELGMTLLLLIGVFWLARTGARLTGAGAGESRGVVLIDSGHGGSDPGKIGIHQDRKPAQKAAGKEWGTGLYDERNGYGSLGWNRRKQQGTGSEKTL